MKIKNIATIFVMVALSIVACKKEKSAEKVEKPVRVLSSVIDTLVDGTGGEDKPKPIH